MRRLPPPQAFGDDVDHLRLSEHADLDRVDAHVGEQRVDLLSHELRRDGVHAGHAARALRSQCGDHRAGVGAQRAHRLDVGEHTGAAGRIDAGDGQCGRGAALVRHGSNSVGVSVSRTYVNRG